MHLGTFNEGKQNASSRAYVCTSMRVHVNVCVTGREGGDSSRGGGRCCSLRPIR